MYIGVQSTMSPDIGFVIEVNEQIDKAKELIREGFKTWICIGSYDFPTEYYTEEDYLWLHDCGYSEPSIELLDRFGIPHGDSYTCFDEDGEFVSPWDETEIEWVY